MLNKSTNPDIYQPTCTSKNGGLVDRLNKVKAKAEAKEKVQEAVVEKSADQPAKVQTLDVVLENAQAAGPQKQTALMAEKALVKLLKHLNGRWFGFWEEGGKKAAVEGLIGKLRAGKIGSDEFVKQLGSPAVPGEEPTLYDTLNEKTGFIPWSLYSSSASAFKAKDAEQSYLLSLPVRRAG